MSISKKNLDKLRNLIKDENLMQDNNISNYNNSKNQEKKENPSEIFYSVIDNSESLKETSHVNHVLRKSEEEFINSKSNRTEHFKYLTIEDELYDEFNYLLGE